MFNIFFFKWCETARAVDSVTWWRNGFCFQLIKQAPPPPRFPLYPLTPPPLLWTLEEKKAWTKERRRMKTENQTLLSWGGAAYASWRRPPPHRRPQTTDPRVLIQAWRSGPTGTLESTLGCFGPSLPLFLSCLPEAQVSKGVDLDSGCWETLLDCLCVRQPLTDGTNPRPARGGFSSFATKEKSQVWWTAVLTEGSWLSAEELL